MSLWPAWYLPPQPRKDVVDQVCAAFSISRGELTGQNRSQVHLGPRWIAATLLRERGLSSLAIGRMLNRDHTSVLHGVRELPHRLARHPQWADALDRLRLDLGSVKL